MSGYRTASAYHELGRDCDRSHNALRHALIGNGKGRYGDDESEQRLPRIALPEFIFSVEPPHDVEWKGCKL